MRAKLCEACGKRAARYVCQECGREVCEVCLDPRMWVCSDCYGRLRREAPMLGKEGSELLRWLTPLKLFLLGFFLIFIGMIIMVITAIFFGAPSSLSTGTVIWILPFPPIILGAGEYSSWAIVLALGLTILGAAILIIFRKRG